MKTSDLTKTVMQKIVSYEEKRTTRWLRLFFGTLAALLFITTGIMVFTIKQMIDFQTFDLLSLFQEDREVILEFWQDTLAIFWAELPQWTVVAAILALMLIIITIISTRSRRRMINKKLSELAKYRKNR